MADVIRYGVLGAGRIATGSHIPAAQRTTNSVIAAIASRDERKAQQWADRLGIAAAYGSYEALLAAPEIDAVINALPNSMHCEWTVKAAEAGKHILCEKPFALTIAEARHMIDAARANNVMLMEGFTQRFSPLFQAMSQLIATGEIGDVHIVKSELTYTLQDWEHDSRVRRDLGGGSLLDAGCYCVTTIRALVGDVPSSVQAYERVRPTHGVDELFMGLLEFPGDRLAYIASGMGQPFRFSCEVIGSSGWLHCADLFQASELQVVRGDQVEIRRYEHADRFRLQLEHFSDCILNGREPLLSPQDALDNTAVLAALKQAAQEKRAVQIDRQQA